MPVEFRLPDVGEGVTEGEIVRWLVEVGDPVTEDQPVAEVETDKAVVEVPSPVDGTVAELRAEAGEVVPVGEVIITFEVEGEAETEETAPAAAEEEAAPEGRVFAAPSARRLARELEVDIATVEGTGPGGRVTESDVRAAAESGEQEPAAAEPAGEPAAETEPAAEPPGEPAGAPAEPTGATDRDRTLAAPATRRLAEEMDVDLDSVPASEEREGEAFVTAAAVREYAEAQQAAQAADAAALATGEEREREERIPYRGVRRTIGEQMERSKFTAPHVTHHDEVDVTELVATRERLRPRAEERGISLSYMPFVMKAVVAALQEYPVLNSALDEENEEIVHKHYYNVGVATATEAGLMVPVVEDVDRKGLLQVASEMNELVAKARERTIAREEMQGGTFSITNFGAIGGEYATPIINYPETAILGLGAIRERPRVVDGEVVPREVMTLSLSIDHRVIDGAEAARFTNELKTYLEHPSLLLLE